MLKKKKKKTGKLFFFFFAGHIQAFRRFVLSKALYSQDRRRWSNLRVRSLVQEAVVLMGFELVTFGSTAQTCEPQCHRFPQSPGRLLAFSAPTHLDMRFLGTRAGKLRCKIVENSCAYFSPCTSLRPIFHLRRLNSVPDRFVARFRCQII